MEIRAGENLGRYQLLAEIGRGAMGTVYQALDPDIDRLVAIKVFSVFDATSADGPAFRESFAQEARAAGRLMHPGIVAIYDRGEDPESQTPYIVMEYVAGQPLSSLLSTTAVRLEERFSLQIARQVAEALAYAHERGVVHRDIKPSNILMTEEGVAKIADFGIARLDAADTLFRGEVLGTPAYMSPEQLTGGEVDGRTDIFSLGVILYTMLSGFRPFQGNGASTIGFKVVNQNPVPITNFHLDLSKDTEYVVARAMAKNPAERYTTGLAFAQDLGDILNGNEPRSRRESSVPVSAEVFQVARDYRPFLAVGKPAIQSTRAGIEAVVPSTAAVAERTPTPVMGVTPAAARSAPGAGWRAAIPAIVLALGALSGIAAFAGVYVDHVQLEKLHAADVQLGMPPLLSEQIVIPALAAERPEPEVVVLLPRAKATGASEKAPDNALDYTVVRQPQRVAAAIPLPVVLPTTSRTIPRIDPAPVRPPTTLQFALQHQFLQANVSLWVDGKLLYSGVSHGETRKRLLVLPGGIEGREMHEIRFPSGEHEIRVRVTSKSGPYDESGSIHSTFPETQRAMLDIRCYQRGIELKLNGK